MIEQPTKYKYPEHLNKRNYDDTEQPTEHPYIVTNEKLRHGEPIVKGTATSVRAIVEYWRGGRQPEQIVQALPHVSLAAVFDALSYYQDHMKEINKYIEMNRIPKDKVHPLIKEMRKQRGLVV